MIGGDRREPLVPCPFIARCVKRSIWRKQNGCGCRSTAAVLQAFSTLFLFCFEKDFFNLKRVSGSSLSFRYFGRVVRRGSSFCRCLLLGPCLHVRGTHTIDQGSARWFMRLPVFVQRSCFFVVGLPYTVR